MKRRGSAKRQSPTVIEASHLIVFPFFLIFPFLRTSRASFKERQTIRASQPASQPAWLTDWLTETDDRVSLFFQVFSTTLCRSLFHFCCCCCVSIGTARAAWRWFVRWPEWQWWGHHRHRGLMNTALFQPFDTYLERRRRTLFSGSAAIWRFRRLIPPIWPLMVRHELSGHSRSKSRCEHLT